MNQPTGLLLLLTDAAKVCAALNQPLPLYAAYDPTSPTSVTGVSEVTPQGVASLVAQEIPTYPALSISRTASAGGVSPQRLRPSLMTLNIAYLDAVGHQFSRLQFDNEAHAVLVEVLRRLMDRPYLYTGVGGRTDGTTDYTITYLNGGTNSYAAAVMTIQLFERTL